MRSVLPVIVVLLCCVAFTSGQCPPLSAPTYGSLFTLEDGIIMVTCDPGFVVYGASDLLTCLPSNQWDLPMPMCVVDCSNNFIPDVQPFTGEWSGDIAARVELTLTSWSGLIGTFPSGPTVAYSYFGQVRVPAPTILMRAGTVCNVRIINRLSDPPVGDPDYNKCPYFANRLHCTNTTNLHVHGLHVAPQEDDVGRAVSPGNFSDYIYFIPSDHQAGTFWYHAHVHGAVGAQVGLAAGALIMLQNEEVLPTPSEWADLYVDQRLVVFHSIGGQAFPNVSAQNSFYSVNGVNNPAISINSNSSTLFRFVHAAGGFKALSLNLVDPSNTCRMTLVARDGIQQYVPFLSPQYLIVPQGGRADVALYCGSAAQGAAISMQSAFSAAHSAFLAVGNVITQSSLFTLNVQAPPSTARTVPLNNKPLPDALQDLTNANAAATTGVTLSFTTGISGVIFGGMGRGAPAINPTPLQINGIYSYGLTTDLAKLVHPFHQHINAMQIQSFTGATEVPEISRIGEWRDVIPVHGGITVNVKQRVTDFWGQQIIHCHIFLHEDIGMMGIIQIAEPPAPTCGQYVQRGYAVSGCSNGTIAGSSCTAVCADGFSGDVRGAVSCQQLSKWIHRAGYVGQFTGCS